MAILSDCYIIIASILYNDNDNLKYIDASINFPDCSLDFYRLG